MLLIPWPIRSCTIWLSAGFKAHGLTRYVIFFVFLHYLILSSVPDLRPGGIYIGIISFIEAIYFPRGLRHMGYILNKERGPNVGVRHMRFWCPISSYCYQWSEIGCTHWNTETQFPRFLRRTILPSFKAKAVLLPPVNELVARVSHYWIATIFWDAKHL